MKLSIIIPVYNEIQTIEEILRRILAVGLASEIVIVDDGSTDGTREYITALQDQIYHVILHETNQGKGAAVLTGIRNATGDRIPNLHLE